MEKALWTRENGAATLQRLQFGDRMDTVEEIKSRLPIEELVAHYVTLKKMGRHFKGLCPFHNEKTPSFIVSPEKNLAYCFGCHRGGDIFKFTEEIEGVDFVSALKILADRTGVKLPEGARGGESIVKKSEKDRLFEIMRQAQRFFESALWGEEGREALSYLRKRGFPDEMIRAFGVGYAPNAYDILHPGLMRAGANSRDLLQLGLAFSRQTNIESLGDFFRHRVIFPIYNVHGDPVAFGGRIIREDDEPKYLNSPESPIFSKRNTLYGLSHAKTAIRKKNRALIVEGYTDVIASHMAGEEIALASCGTALTSEQIKLIKRYTPTVLLSFDTDTAGKMAQKRATELCQTEGMNIYYVVPDGKDAAEIVKSDPGKWKELCENAPYYLDYLYSRSEAFLKEGKSFERQKKAMQAIAPIMAHIRDHAERSSAATQFAKLLGTTADALLKSVNEILQSEQRVVGRTRRTAATGNEASRSETIKNHPNEGQYLIGLIMSACERRWPVEDIFAQLNEDNFSSDLEKRLYKLIKEFYSNPAPDAASQSDAKEIAAFLSSLDDVDREQVQIFSLYADSRNSTLSQDELHKEIQATVARFVNKKSKSNLQKIIARMKEAEGSGDKQAFETALQDHQNEISLWQKK